MRWNVSDRSNINCGVGPVNRNCHQQDCAKCSCSETYHKKEQDGHLIILSVRNCESADRELFLPVNR